MYAMDLWPESLLSGGISNKSLIYKHYKKVSAKIYSKCDKILVSTKEHIDYIKSLPGCSDLDIEYLAQYADTIFEESNYETIDNGVIDLMFAGNIGKAQSADTIIKAAALLKDNPKYKFHIVGGGSELENIKKLAKELKADNVIFYGQKPLSDMPELYKLADAMLVTLEDKSYANMTIPGKVQSYMAVGKPIIGAVNGSCANFIKNNQVGYACNAEDSEALAKLILEIDEKEIKNIGKNAREVYLRKYSKEKFINKLIETLKDNDLN
jgi:glycosyltransferase involved in cell wall biosynthesis